MILEPVEGALTRIKDGRGEQQRGLLGSPLLLLFSFFRIVVDNERLISPNRCVQVFMRSSVLSLRCSASSRESSSRMTRALAERSAASSRATSRTSEGRRCSRRRRHQRARLVLLVRPQADHEQGTVVIPCKSPVLRAQSASKLQNSTSRVSILSQRKSTHCICTSLAPASCAYSCPR